MTNQALDDLARRVMLDVARLEYGNRNCRSMTFPQSLSER